MYFLRHLAWSRYDVNIEWCHCVDGGHFASFYRSGESFQVCLGLGIVKFFQCDQFFLTHQGRSSSNTHTQTHLKHDLDRTTSKPKYSPWGRKRLNNKHDFVPSSQQHQFFPEASRDSKQLQQKWFLVRNPSRVRARHFRTSGKWTPLAGFPML